MFIALAAIVASAGFIDQVQAGLPDRVQNVRTAEIKQLIAAATPLLASSDRNAKYPVQALGILRAEEAVPLLVKHIVFSPPAKKIMPTDKSSNALCDMLPCVYALGKIGHPCFDAVIDKTCKTDDDYHVMCAAIVFRTSVGADDAIAILQAKSFRCKDAGEKSRINQIITAVDKTYRQVDFR